MPLPPADDNLSVNRKTGSKVPQSRTGKFFQGIFGKKEPEQPEKNFNPQTFSSSAASRTDNIQPPQEFIQVMTEPTGWDDEEESNWDDDFLDEPAAVTPQPISSPPPPPPPAFRQPEAPSAEKPADLSESETLPLEVEELNTPVATISEELTAEETSTPEPAIANPPATPLVTEESDLTKPDLTQVETELELETEQPATPPAPTSTPVEPPTPSAPLADNSTISVNIPRPKNIKYKTKSPQNESPKITDSGPEKVEAVELHIKRPTTVKYKTKPVPQASFIEKILDPGKKLWQKVQTIGDFIPTQLTENPKKALGILAAVVLSIATSWIVVNFWPSSSNSAMAPAVTNQPEVTSTPITNPEETFFKAVQSQFSALASQYPAGLITNLELNNDRQLATITLGKLWGTLTPNQQQQVAQSLWQQSLTYKMSKIEIRSENGNLLARTPIVGQEMVIVSSW